MRSLPMHRSRVAALMLALGTSGLVGACDDDADDGDTAATPSTAAASTAAPTTAGMGSNVESLSYLIQGLLTTEQVGGGWVDQGRRIVPPGSDQLSGFLCEEGETTVAALDGRLDPQVSTTYERPDDVGLTVSESLMWGEREQVTADFEALGAALDACAGATYATENLGEVALDVDEPPAVGVSAISFHVAPATPPSDTPWLAFRSTAVLLSDPNEPVALVVSVGATTVHDPPGVDVTELDPAEYTRIVETAVQRIVEDGL